MTKRGLEKDITLKPRVPTSSTRTDEKNRLKISMHITGILNLGNSRSSPKEKGNNKSRLFFLATGIIVLLILICIIILWKMNPELLDTLISIIKNLQEVILTSDILVLCQNGTA